MKRTTILVIVAGIILAGWSGTVLAAPQFSVACKSNIFECSKLAYVPLPDGKRCSMSSVSLNAREQLLMLEGDKVTLFFNPKTQQAVACLNNNNGACPETSGFMTAGNNPDGSSHLMLLLGNDGLIIPNPASVFASLMTNAKPLIEVVSNQITQSCDDMLADIKIAAEKAGFKVPPMDFVELGGVQIPVKVGKFTLEGNRAVIQYNYGYGNLKPPPNPLPANEGQLVPGVAVVTIGDAAETVTRIFKPFPNTINGFIGAGFLTIVGSSDQAMNVALVLIKQDETLGVFDCNFPMDEITPMTCSQEGMWPKGDKAMMKPVLRAILKEVTLRGTGSEDLGVGLADILVDNNLPLTNKPIAHDFEGFNDVPNAIYYDQAGGHVYRLNPDKTVTAVAGELLPSAKECMLVDFDDYAGKDLVCFEGDGVSDVIYYLTKRNLVPQLGDMTIKQDVLTVDLFQLSAAAKTQEDEVLTYAWGINRMKGNVLTEINGAFDNPAAEKPLFRLSSLGAKDSADLAEGGYFATLSVCDAGGLCAKVMGPIPMKSLSPSAPPSAEPAAPPAPIKIPTTPVLQDNPAADTKAATTPPPTDSPPSDAVSPAASMWVFEGCSTLPNAPSSNFIWILVIPALMTRLVRAAYRRK